jgi:hypothetical protein
VDDHLGAIVEDQHNQLQHQSRPIRPEDQPTSWRIIIADLVLDQRLIDGMNNVVVWDTVLPRRLVDLHTPQTYYEWMGMSIHEPADSLSGHSLTPPDKSRCPLHHRTNERTTRNKHQQHVSTAFVEVDEILIGVIQRR